ncbi:MAG: hypothetical protein U5N85_11580 [Arcicella sp.]|nr:hypothetical protein [Arcicella sp.]
MDKALNINKINSNFYSWRVADARVVGGKNTNNGWNFSFQQGHHHQLSDMRINLNLTNANILGIDKTITSNTRQYDLKLKGSLGNGYKEYKSYGSDQIEDKIAKRNWGTEFDQFLAYLKAPETTDMGSPIDPAKPTLEYIFNVRLQSEGNIKTAFQNLFCDKCNEPTVTTKTLSPQGVKVFEAIWGNAGLRSNIFGTITIEADAKDEFLDLIKSTSNNKVYGFIKSR